jgi:hypothetical protein
LFQGFMGRLMIRLLGFPIAAQVFWRNGMLARIARYAPFLRFASHFPNGARLKPKGSHWGNARHGQQGADTGGAGA